MNIGDINEGMAIKMGTAPSSINEYLNFLFFFIFLWLFTLSYLVGNYVTW